MSDDKVVVGKVVFGPGELSALRAQAYPDILNDDGREWKIAKIGELQAELAALKAELAAKSECMDGALSDCHELIKQNAALKALVRELGKAIGFTALALELYNPNSTLVESGFEIIARPDVKAITEAPA